jgi:hypothetical protein
MSAEIAASSAHLFRPAVAHRIRRSQNTDTPLPPEEPVGQNPPDGAIVYYYLQAAASEPVTIEIFDAAKKLVRRYSSDDKPEPIDPELNVPTYWIRPANIPPSSAGMHRFVWDLHYPPPGVLEHEYPISAIYRDTPRYPLGAVVLPGQYSVKLTAGGKSYVQPLTVKMDPRVKTPPAGLVQQFTLATKITGMLHWDYEALLEVRALRAKLKDRNPDAEKQAAALEGPGGGRIPGVRRSGDANLTTLNGELASVLGVIEGSDSVPTQQAVAAVGELERTLRSLRAALRELRAKAK